MKHWTDKHPFWLGENGRRAEAMWADRHTFRQIAKALGTSRNAVASYIRRKGLLREPTGKRPVTKAPIPAAPTFALKVVEVLPAIAMAGVVGQFDEKAEAWACAKEAWKNAGSLRFIFSESRKVGGVSNRPLNNDLWREAEKIAERCLR